jgi:hypothetical protein
MKKIEWKPKGSSSWVIANIGGITMMCCRIVGFTKRAKPRWRASVKVAFQGLSTKRFGPNRLSMKKAKEDAVRMAREFLLDYHAGLTIAMNEFDLCSEGMSDE